MSKSSYVASVDAQYSEQIHDYLVDQGCLFSKPAHTLFQAKKPGLCVTFYKSGKLLVTGKKGLEFVEFYLEPEILKTTELTAPQPTSFDSPKIGSDEAGKGDFFGPLCIASAYANDEAIKKLYALGIQDSKKIKDDKILVLDKEVRKCCSVEVIVLKPEKYNELYKKIGNLNHLLAWAHCAALTALSEKTGCKEVLVDQFASPDLLESYVAKKPITLNLTQRTKAEEDIVVAAASIVARASFVKGIEELEVTYKATLPKGASSAVVQAGRHFVQTQGSQRLSLVAKTHFKTTQQVLDLGELF